MVVWAGVIQYAAVDTYGEEGLKMTKTKEKRHVGPRSARSLRTALHSGVKRACAGNEHYGVSHCGDCSYSALMLAARTTLAHFSRTLAEGE
jgi:hypothetical protein